MAGSETPSDKMLAMIDCLAESRAPLSITEIAMRLALPVPTAHRIASHLTVRGYLRRMPGSKRFRVGPRLVALGVKTVAAAIGGDRPHMVLVALARRLGEHCQIGIVQDDQVVYIDSARADRSWGLQFQPGHAAPVYCTSIGKMHLAQLDDDVLADFLDRLPLERFTPSTLLQPKAIRAEIQKVRRRGWASTDGEYTPGVVGCAVPIYDRRKRMIAGLGVAAPQARVALQSLRLLVPPMQEAAREIAEALSEDAETP